jgi:SAM-dependent methyltransferase
VTDTIEQAEEGAGLLGGVLSAPRDRPLVLENAVCAVCGTNEAEPLAVGEDFEYRTSPDSFLAVQCRRCGLVYLDKRPAESELGRIYPDDYHAFVFSAENFGFVYRVRRRLEARRLLRAAKGLPRDARVLDVGCGDGFHLGLLQEYGKRGWRLEGVDSDHRAVRRAGEAGLTVHEGTVQDVELETDAFDLVLLIQTIEHVGDPGAVLRRIHDLLRPGGRLLIVTDNTGSLDFTIFKRRHWGGYHFPRHWNLFNGRALRLLAEQSGFAVETLTTMVSPVNWVYSVRNTLDDWGAPRGLVAQFSLESAPSLAAFTAFDAVHRLAGRGALLRAVLQKPERKEVRP